ncbi:MAG: phosphate ABC transporter ATP-binding protein [Actinomycetota bacterium]|jgi:phosphate transport system ATP-binding protein|nr:phosphate ABC transporter ATP-binding protein [Actinomycetota bacterium]MDA8292900.1 phosphate ABC transporter ATP-binding protein [Actinomycetota bacterium]
MVQLLENATTGLAGSSLPAPEPLAARVALAAHGLTLSYGGTRVLADVDLDVPTGAVTALVGPTGCGKTTFLRSLNRMNDRVPGFRLSGSLELFGEDLYDGRSDPLVVRRRVGMLFQRPNPFPLSIRENVVAGVKAHRLARRSELDSIAEERLRQVGLWEAVSDRLGTSPFRLSGGQQQLLCLARALAVSPEVLLLDEPTSSLDPVSTAAVEEMLASLVPDITVVIVTHNLAQARRLADHTAFFHQGRLVEHGPTVRLFEDPSEEATRQYLSGRFG